MPSTATSGPHAAGEALDPLRALQLAERYPVVLAAFARAYVGRHDPLDALWWWAHPLTTAPSGADDPAASRSTLAASAYSREASAEAAAALTVLDGELKADAEARARAVQDARPAFDRADHLEAARPTRPADDDSPAHKSDVDASIAIATATNAIDTATTATGAIDTATATDATTTDATATDATPTATDATPTDTAATATDVAAWRRRSFIWMASTAAVTLLLLTGIAVVVVQQLNPGASPGSAILQPTSTPAGTDDPNRGLTIFEDPGLAPSIPPAGIDPYYQPDTLRLLGVADADLTVYAVENRIDQPCLLAVYTDGSQSATCVTREEFEAEGIELRITSLRVTSANNPVSNTRIGQDVVFWKSNGTYGVSSSPARASGAGQASNSGSLSGPSSSFVGGTPGATPDAVDPGPTGTATPAATPGE